jgi:hypothetical protein
MDGLDATPELLVTNHPLHSIRLDCEKKKAALTCAALVDERYLLLVCTLVVLVSTAHAGSSFRPNLDRRAGKQSA